jgi:hypothetical protein
MSLGPMTGRAAGFCAGFSVPGYMNPIAGRGYGGRGRGFWGRGAGRGFRNRYYATGLPAWTRAGFGFWPAPTQTVPAEHELAGLKQQAELMQDTLGRINKRIEQLEK